jgi:hypothetical protein
MKTYTSYLTFNTKQRRELVHITGQVEEAVHLLCGVRWAAFQAGDFEGAWGIADAGYQGGEQA